MSSTLTALDARAGIGQMAESGLSVRQIARITGLGKSTVHDVLTGKYGLSSTRANVVMNKVTVYRTEQRLASLHRQGMSYRDIARITGLGKSTVNGIVNGKSHLSIAAAHKATVELTKERGMRMLTETGFKVVAPLRLRDWSLLGQHARAVRHYQETGDTSLLLKLRGKVVKTTLGDLPLITDPDVIKRLSKQGSLDVDDLIIGESPGRKRRR